MRGNSQAEGTAVETGIAATLIPPVHGVPHDTLIAPGKADDGMRLGAHCMSFRCQRVEDG